LKFRRPFAELVGGNDFWWIVVREKYMGMQFGFGSQTSAACFQRTAAENHSGF
jgi:hypothetical protein